MERNMFDYGKNFVADQNWNDEFSSDPAQESTNFPEKMGKIVSSTGLVNLRRDPSMDNDPITTINHGEEVIILSEHDDSWYKIMAPNGEEGYVMKKLVELI